MISRRRLLLGGAASLSLAGYAGRGAALAPGMPSRTAYWTALERAAHQLLESPRVFDDPVALAILGDDERQWLEANLGRYRQQRARAMRAFLVMRSRFAEDELARAFSRGVRQYVVLGAGLDTFAIRNPHPGLQVFEVDHPATQAWKRDRLAQRGIAPPASLTFAPVDFERESLGEGLRRAGFRRERPVFVSWLGVTIYLTQEAVRGTLRALARECVSGSEIVFDFALPDYALSESEQRTRAELAALVASVGEPWISFFDDTALADEMRSMGYARAEVLDSAKANERYFHARSDGFRLYGSGRMMAAEI